MAGDVLAQGPARRSPRSRSSLALVPTLARPARRRRSTAPACCSRRSAIGPSSSASSRRPRQGGLVARTLRFGLALVLARRLRRLGAPRADPMLDLELFRNLRSQRRERVGDRRVLRALRLHLPRHPVLPVPQGLRRRSRRACGSCRWRRRGDRVDRRHAASRSAIGNKVVVSAGLAVRRGDVRVDLDADRRPPTSRSPRRWSARTGMGLTSAPATESIMGAVPERNAGVGSGVNDATRELGGTLGVAVIGSVFASLYAARSTGRPRQAPESVGAALGVADGASSRGRLTPAGAPCASSPSAGSSTASGRLPRRCRRLPRGRALRRGGPARRSRRRRVTARRPAAGLRS